METNKGADVIQGQGEAGEKKSLGQSPEEPQLLRDGQKRKSAKETLPQGSRRHLQVGTVHRIGCPSEAK